MAESEDSDKVVDYYAILNVRKEANENEIKAAYRRMCMLYHPDKHRDPEKKKIAEELFSKIQKAYEVLSCTEKRGIYDIYGQKGLDAGWEVIERQRTPAEIREEYERLKREREERRLQELTNPTGSIVVNVDATDLFDRYEDTDFDGSFFPNIEVKSMSISQSIEAPLTSADTLTLAGSVNIKNGNGSGSVSVSARRVVSHRAWGSVTFEAGKGPQLTFRAFANVTQKSYCNAGMAFGSKGDAIIAAGSCMLARQLDRHTVGYITYQGGLQTAMSTTVVRETENSRAVFRVQLSLSDSFLLGSYTRKIEKNTKLRGTIKESEAKREKVAKQMAENKKEAENSIRLMQETCERIVEYESSRLGLVIVNAWYGHLVAMEESAQEIHRVPSKVIDVTVPVQCQVKDSRLFLTESSKSNLSGFYDPCPEEEKMLRIRYLFREAIHEVTVGDEEPVKIPKQSHKIQTS
ncbi:PREDICTED: dnaJ homolog subfamily C member 11-like [Acropora digitifera]|uniref:dnaJ homolog subfamily C member 11-like n=1 Tax=Acropora digitifera TaxID=70779 RepID=UPI00077AF302|nr:PREDICTED: dnaJ homolog subfamily C member 11-like [Acropora digitifera]